MDSFDNKDFDIDLDNSILSPLTLKLKDIFRLSKNTPYENYINNNLQQTNLKWIYPSFTAVLFLELTVGFRYILEILQTNSLFKYSLLSFIVVHIIFGFIFFVHQKITEYKKKYDYIIFCFLLLFIIYQCIFYWSSWDNEISFFYFVVVSIALSIFPAIHTKYIFIYTFLNYSIFIIMDFYKSNNFAINNISPNPLYISIITLLLSVYFYASRINVLINNKKVSLVVKEITTTNNQLNYLNSELEKISYTDSLTKISNRRAYEMEVGIVWSHAMRAGSFITFFVIDIDYFKKYNDYFGHLKGDECLIKVASCIKTCFKRKGDIVARVGGEEFVVVLSSVDSEKAKLLAERVLNCVRNLKLEHPESHIYPYVTISIGIVSLVPTKDLTVEEVYNFADKALYQAKKTGKNKYCFDHNFSETQTSVITKETCNFLDDSKRLLSVLEITTLCSFCVDYSTGKIEFSKNILSVLDLKSTSLESFADLYYYVLPEDIPRLDSLVKALFNPDFKDIDLEFRLVQKNGIPIWIKSQCCIIRDSEKKPIYIMGSFMDIDEYKQQQSLIEDLLDGRYVYDLKNDMGAVHGRVLKFLNISNSDSVNFSKWMNAIYIEDRNIFKTFFHSIKNNIMTPLNFEYRFEESPEKFIWFSSRNKIYYDSDDNPFLIVGSILNLNSLDYYNRFIKDESLINPISDLPHRVKFYEDFENILSNKNSKGYLFLIDIDNFSNVNTIFSYSVGNRFLRDFGNLINNNKLFFGKVYHFESDLYAIIFPNLTEEQAERQLRHLKKTSNSPISCKGISYQYSISISCIEYPTFGSTVEELLRNSDMALHKIKIKEKNNTILFTKELYEENISQLELEMELRKSVDNNMRGFLLYYHPLLSAETNNCIGAEALIRWQTNSGKILLPAAFLPSLESTGLMNKVGDWVIRTAASQCKKWLLNNALISEEYKFSIDDDFSISINISAHQLISDNFEKDLLNFLKEINLESKHIKLELTEEALIMDIQRCAKILNSLREKGIKISIDDFGTGYSSLSYFKNLPVDEIKIDKSFISDIENDHFCQEFVNSIIKITQSIDMSICVEGVETETQASILRNLNANTLQGFLYSEPIPESKFEELFFKKSP